MLVIYQDLCVQNVYQAKLFNLLEAHILLNTLYSYMNTLYQYYSSNRV